MNCKRVDKYIEPAGYVPETIADKLKHTQEELGRHSKMALSRTIKASVLWCAFGAALGMTGMVYWYEHQPKPQPVVTSPTAVSIDRLADIERRMAALEASKEANAVRAEQRVMDMRTALDKLERLKAKQDGQLMRVAQDGARETSQDAQRLHAQQARDAAPLSIQQMARELGVSRMVVE